MNPSNPPAQPAETATTNPTPIYDGNCYYFPSGIVFARRGRVVVYPGWVIMMDAVSNEETYRVALTAPFAMQTVLGTSQFQKINGQKLGIADKRKYSFYLYNPSHPFNTLLYIAAALSSKKRHQSRLFDAACKQAAGVAV